MRHRKDAQPKSDPWHDQQERKNVPANIDCRSHFPLLAADPAAP